MAFWQKLGKKTIQKEKSNLTSETRSNPLNNNVSPTLIFPSNGDLSESLFSEVFQNIISDKGARIKQHPKLSDNGFKDFGDLGEFNPPAQMRPRIRRSRLTRNLPEILCDTNSLSYFQQFLESREAATYLSLLNDIKNCNLLATSISTGLETSIQIGDDSGIETKSSPVLKENHLQRLLTSTSSSSGFSDDTNSESPVRQAALSFKATETDTMVHSLSSERRRIVQKYFDVESSDYLPSISHCIKEVDLTCAAYEPSLECLNDIQQCVWDLLENEYLPDYLHSEYHYKYQIEILTGGKLSITDILYNDTFLFYFMEFMEQEGKRQFIEFWIAADNFRSQWNTQNACSDALIIYNKYFSLQAEQPLGVSNAVRCSIEENICSSTGPGPDCFENALHVIFCAIEKNNLQKFLTSQVYLLYISEVFSLYKNSALSNCALSRNKRSGSSSTLNSEVSGISNSTYSTGHYNGVSPQIQATSPHLTVSNTPGLTNAENTMIRLVNSISNESLAIDVKQLNDPDALWKRKKYGLSLGYLTPLGRFCTEVEPQPDRKTESKLTKAVRRFVMAEEEQDQEKEEDAWQVAEMIVREITAITMYQGDISDIPAINNVDSGQKS